MELHLRWDDDHESGRISSGQAIVDLTADELFLSRFENFSILDRSEPWSWAVSRLVEHFEMCLKWLKLGLSGLKVLNMRLIMISQELYISTPASENIYSFYKSQVQV